MELKSLYQTPEILEFEIIEENPILTVSGTEVIPSTPEDLGNGGFEIID